MSEKAFVSLLIACTIQALSPSLLCRPPIVDLLQSRTMIPSQTVRPQTIKQAKGTYNAQGGVPRLTEKERRQLQRGAELDERCKAIREREQKRKAAVAKRDERARRRRIKTAKEVQQSRLTGIQERVQDAFGHLSDQSTLCGFVRFRQPAAQSVNNGTISVASSTSEDVPVSSIDERGDPRPQSVQGSSLTPLSTFPSKPPLTPSLTPVLNNLRPVALQSPAASTAVYAPDTTAAAFPLDRFRSPQTMPDVPVLVSNADAFEDHTAILQDDSIAGLSPASSLSDPAFVDTFDDITALWQDAGAAPSSSSQVS